MGRSYNALVVLGWYFTSEQLASKFPVVCKVCKTAETMSISKSKAEKLLIDAHPDSEDWEVYCHDDPAIFEQAFIHLYTSRYNMHYHMAEDCDEARRYFISIIPPIQGDVWNISRYPLDLIRNLPDYRGYMDIYDLPEPEIICTTNVC